jgi:hypothetical protein
VLTSFYVYKGLYHVLVSLIFILSSSKFLNYFLGLHCIYYFKQSQSLSGTKQGLKKESLMPQYYLAIISTLLSTDNCDKKKMQACMSKSNQNQNPHLAVVTSSATLLR